MQQQQEPKKTKCQWIEHLSRAVMCVVGFTTLLSVNFGLYNSYEPHQRHGMVVAAYVKHTTEVTGSQFDVWEVVSYPRTTHHGATFFRNCSLYLTSYDSRAHAIDRVEAETLGQSRHVFPSKKASDCVELDRMQQWLITGSVLAFITFPMLLCTIFDFRTAYKELNAEEAGVTVAEQNSPLVQVIAVSSSRTEALTLNQVELSV